MLQTVELSAFDVVLYGTNVIPFCCTEGFKTHALLTFQRVDTCCYNTDVVSG